MKLTNKQEAFALKYAECDSAHEAYKHAYNCENMKPETISNNGYKLLKKNDIATRIKELKDKKKAIAEERFGYTIERLIMELEEARQAALCAETVQASAAAGATMSKAKLCGFLIDKKDVTNSDGSLKPQPVDKETIKKIMEDLENGC